MIELFQTTNVLSLIDIMNNNPNKDILFANKERTVLRMIRVGELRDNYPVPSRVDLWRIIRFTTTPIYSYQAEATSIEQSRLSKEQFVDMILANYPDCFDWFMFNMEWLK